ncbi:hypothetical protein EDB87DRAFT_1628493 [Lactarius vividus]|nr:hypothetical protein EDB87DRAFT_1628493 [Lactarius vividus]
MINAPRLEDINITFFSQPTLDASQLGLFIDRIETLKSPLRAEILSSGDSISVTFTRPGALSTLLGLQVSLSSISQIYLVIETIEPSSVPDDMDGEQWLRLIRAFDGAKDFRVGGEFATDILRALRPEDEKHTTVLPALQNLHVLEPTFMYRPLRDSAQSFVTWRPPSSHSVQIHYQTPGWKWEGHMDTPDQA